MKIYHGSIVSLDSTNSVHSYLVEENGRIVFLGDTLPDRFASGGLVEELGEKALLPSFGDGHLHFSNWALFAASYFDTRDARTIKEVQDIIRDFMARRKPKKFVIGFGFSRHSIREKRMITRTELDAACPDIPLLIACYDGHSAVCNTPMINRFPETIRRLRGFDRDLGHLFNEAFQEGTDAAAALIPPTVLVKSIIKGYDIIAEYGTGLIHPVEGIGFPRDMDITLSSLIARAQAHRNRFQTRLFFQTMDVRKVLKRKLPRIGGCFATALDGCLGACDAALHEPYANDPTNRGILFQPEETVMAFAKEANRQGLQIAFHAIGDAAVTRAVNAIEAALRDFPRQDHRHTIIHGCLITPRDFDRIVRLGIGVTLQPAFLISHLEPVSYLEEILGDRVRTSSPIKSMLQAGIHVSGGSDAPVAHPDPIEGIYGACNHPYDPAESVSIPEALKMFTANVAWTSFDDKERGSLETGKMADMVILNRNPLAMEPGDLRSLKVENLLLQGREYEPGMGIAGMLRHGLGGRNLAI
ncbi:MAG: amidohydrolase [Pseudomonadota bacterium]